MMKGGRPKDPIWEHFFGVEVDGKLKYARCKICNHQQSIKACRMRDHHKKCAVVSSTAPQSRKRPLDETNSTSESPPLKKVLLQADLRHSVLKTSDSLNQQLDEKVAKFFYGCNIPFAVAEHPLFLDLIQSLRPGYRVPTRKAIGEPLLNRVTEGLKVEMKQHLEGKVVTLVEDGWSNIHNDPVVATCLNV